MFLPRLPTPYENWLLRGAPTHCLECGREFIVTKYLDWVTIRCSKYYPGSRHEFWRMTVPNGFS